MPTLTLTDDQVVELVNQLSPDQQESLLEFLLVKQWDTWLELSRYGQQRARLVAAQRGRDWDAMTEVEREAFIDDMVHEGRPCAM